jgi:DHA1 family multidrug resistance protein-like MFS transporter
VVIGTPRYSCYARPMQRAEAAAARSLRRERIVLMVGFGLGSLAWNVCWPFLPLRIQEVGVSDLGEVARLAGLLALPANLLSAALGPVWSSLGERFGYKLQIMRSHAGTGLSMAALGLARGPVELAGGATMLGVLGGNYPHYMALAASRSHPSEVGRVVGDMQAAGQVGGTIGPLIGGLVAGGWGLTPAFLLSGLISLSGSAMIFAAVRHDAPRRSEVEPTAARGSLGAAFARPEQRWLMVLFLAGETSAQGLRPLIPIVLSTRTDDPSSVATTTGVAVTLVTAATVVAALVVGRLSRRVPPRAILIATLPVAALLAAAIPFVPGIPLLIAVWTLLGLASGAVAPACFAWLGRLNPSGAGGYALLASTSMCGYALGPVIMGQASVYGLDWPFRLTAAMLLGTAVLVAAARLRPPLEAARA